MYTLMDYLAPGPWAVGLYECPFPVRPQAFAGGLPEGLTK